MPTIEENIKTWEHDYDWSQQGDEWSQSCGGPDMQWYGSILPRVHTFLPAATILEIAPGFGRWTQYLKDHCTRLIIVDLNPKCINHCQTRFRECSHISYHVNDGKSLAMVPPDSLDFIFSYDSLVHAEYDAIEAYLSQFAALLRPDGVGIIHHSNFGACTPSLLTKSLMKIPLLGPWLSRSPRLKAYQNEHWRASSMTAQKFADLCVKHGLQCISQELINQSQYLLNDCISVFVKANSHRSRQTVHLTNLHFAQEVSLLHALSPLYGGAGFRPSPPKPA